MEVSLSKKSKGNKHKNKNCSQRVLADGTINGGIVPDSCKQCNAKLNGPGIYCVQCQAVLNRRAQRILDRRFGHNEI